MTALEQLEEKPYRVLTADANTEEWLRLRKLGVGASESAAVLGLTGWGSALTVYRDKTSDEVVDIGNDLMEFGHLAEDVIVTFMERHPERYQFIGDIVPAEGLLQSVEWPWLLGTLDRQVRTPWGETVPLELKSVNDHAAREWREDYDADEPDAFGVTDDRGSRAVVPKKYQVQVQQQIAVTGAPFGYVAAWLGKDRLEVIRVDRDEEFIQTFLVGIVGRFFLHNVGELIPPAPVLGDDLWEVWPGNRGEVKDADQSILDDVFLWRRAGVDKRDAEADYKQRGHNIAAFMENATELRHPQSGEILHTLRAQNGRKSVDLELLKVRYPDAYEACVRDGKPFRVHRATKSPIELEEN